MKQNRQGSEVADRQSDASRKQRAQSDRQLQKGWHKHLQLDKSILAVFFSHEIFRLDRHESLLVGIWSKSSQHGPALVPSSSSGGRVISQMLAPSIASQKVVGRMTHEYDRQGGDYY